MRRLCMIILPQECGSVNVGLRKQSESLWLYVGNDLRATTLLLTGLSMQLSFLPYSTSDPVPVSRTDYDVI